MSGIGHPFLNKKGVRNTKNYLNMMIYNGKILNSVLRNIITLMEGSK